MTNIIDFARQKKRFELKKLIGHFDFFKKDLVCITRLNSVIDLMIENNVNLVSIQNCFDFFLEIFAFGSTEKQVIWSFAFSPDENLAKLRFAILPGDSVIETEKVKMSPWITFENKKPEDEELKILSFRNYIHKVQQLCSQSV